MDALPQPEPAAEKPKKSLTVRVFGVGDGGIKMLEQLLEDGPSPASLVAVNTESYRSDGASLFERISLEPRLLRGLGSCGDPERGRALAEEHAARLKSLCDGQDVVFIIGGLGGGTGSGMAPVIARQAKEAKALVLAFVSLPFKCEGSHRERCAEEALEELRELADAVICLPNQKVFGLINESTGVCEAYALPNRLLADCARSVWRLLTHTSLIEIRLSDLCALLRTEQTECVFAVAEAAGATRSREVLEKLLAHPLLDGGALLSGCEGVVVSVIGGPDLTMTEVDRIMQELNTRCGEASVIMGAVINEAFRERVAVTVVAIRKENELTARPASSRNGVEGLDRQLLNGSSEARPGSRFVPPPPSLPPDQVQQMLARQGSGKSRARKVLPKFRQTHLPLDIISKGRFDKSEPTIHKGEDLDVPTYIRRGVSLN
ncbi:MAG TPA: cell division protein FtsZ [Verrucomicrobiae bacterium]|nr:cell division protein FtsZ [Verrucomicrobiae bacterium]